jgi:hypothetical protein
MAGFEPALSWSQTRCPGQAGLHPVGDTWNWRGSNPRPLRCERSALPSELQPRPGVPRPPPGHPELAGPHGHMAASRAPACCVHGAHAVELSIRRHVHPQVVLAGTDRAGLPFRRIFQAGSLAAGPSPVRAAICAAQIKRVATLVADKLKPPAGGSPRRAVPGICPGKAYPETTPRGPPLSWYAHGSMNDGSVCRSFCLLMTDQSFTGRFLSCGCFQL